MISFKNLILLFPMMTTLVNLLVGLEVLNSKIVLAKPLKSPIIKGQCGRKQKCETLFKQLTKLYPEYIEGYKKQCPANKIIGLEVFDEKKKVSLTCWDAKKLNDGSRWGYSLGKLPTPGNEDKFLTPLPTDPPYAKYLQEKYSNQVKKAQFKCATNWGAFNFLISEDKKFIELQCYFQGGVGFIDDNNDWVKDGETRGAGVDEILGTFPLPTANK
jgi:hypothetical protein